MEVVALRIIDRVALEEADKIDDRPKRRFRKEVGTRARIGEIG
jgi:hypothetical protein